MAVKFPEVEVELIGQDGNAFFIMGRVAKAMQRAGIAKEDIDAYREEATSGDYDNLLRVTMQTVTCDPDGYDDEEDWDYGDFELDEEW